MRKHFSLLIFFAASLLASCSSTPYAEEDPEYSEQYLQDEALIRKYKTWFSTITRILDYGQPIKSEACPAGCFTDIRFSEDKPMFIFEPFELDTLQPGASYFNTDPESNWLAEQEPVLNWILDPENYEAEQHELAEQLRSMIASKYICIYVSDDSASSDPELDSLEQSFTPGFAVGHALIYNMSTQQLTCILDVNTTNDGVVNYKTYADSVQQRTNQVAKLDAVFALRCDFYENIRLSIERQIMESK